MRWWPISDSCSQPVQDTQYVPKNIAMPCFSITDTSTTACWLQGSKMDPPSHLNTVTYSSAEVWPTSDSCSHRSKMNNIFHNCNAILFQHWYFHYSLLIAGIQNGLCICISILLLILLRCDRLLTAAATGPRCTMFHNQLQLEKKQEKKASIGRTNELHHIKFGLQLRVYHKMDNSVTIDIVC